MVVPHRDERPAGPRILQVGIVQVRPVDGAIVVDRRRDVEVGHLFPARVAHDVAQTAVVHPLRPVLRIPDDLVDEVTQMEHEEEAVRLRRLLVLVDHPAVGVLRALIDVLTADEREAHRTRVVGAGCREGASNAASHPRVVREAVPVLARRLQSPGEDAARPIRRGADRGVRRRHHALEGRVLRHLERQPCLFRAVASGIARPEQHAVGLRIARRDPFRKQVATLTPSNARRPRLVAAPGQRGAERGGGHAELPPADSHLWRSI